MRSQKENRSSPEKNTQFSLIRSHVSTKLSGKLKPKSKNNILPLCKEGCFYSIAYSIRLSPSLALERCSALLFVGYFSGSLQVFVPIIAEDELYSVSSSVFTHGFSFDILFEPNQMCAMKL